MVKIQRNDVITAVLALCAGGILGLSQYWEDLSDLAFPSPQSTLWEAGAIDEVVLGDSANIDQLLNLKAPQPGAQRDEWKAFFGHLNQIEMGKRHSNSGATSPLMAWYAYIAKHEPTVLYEMLGSKGLYQHKFDHLLSMGFLDDWYDYVADADYLLLSSRQALASFALSQGQDKARRYTANAFFKMGEEEIPGKSRSINLENIRFAMMGMGPDEKRRTVALLQSGAFKFDPRSVQRLLLVPDIDRTALLPLIRAHAYPQKSMSSYMTTGALLGATDYVWAMIEDVADNANQPTNFYCAACGLTLAIDGLIGQELADASHTGAFSIEAISGGSFLVHSAQKGSSNRDAGNQATGSAL